MTTDYGTDVKTIPSLSPRYEKISGPSVLIESMFRRLSTPKGALWWEPDYGYDLRGLLGIGITVDDSGRGRLIAAKRDIERQLSEDDRVERVSASIVYNPKTREFSVKIDAYSTFGPFWFVMNLDSAGVLKLLEANSG